MTTPRAIVGRLSRARRVLCTGNRVATAVKRQAHRRHRAAWRNWIAARDFERDDPTPRPATGWDVS